MHTFLLALGYFAVFRLGVAWGYFRAFRELGRVIRRKASPSVEARVRRTIKRNVNR